MSYSLGNATTLNNLPASYYISGQLPAPTNISAVYTALPADNVILCAAGALGYTVTLPVAGITAGKVYNVKKISGAGAITLAVNGGALIDGAASLVLSVLNVNAQLFFDGTNYWLL